MIYGLDGGHSISGRQPGTFVDSGLSSDYVFLNKFGSTNRRIVSLTNNSRALQYDAVNSINPSGNFSKGLYGYSGFVNRISTIHRAPNNDWVVGGKGGYSPVTVAVFYKVEETNAGSGGAHMFAISNEAATARCWVFNQSGNFIAGAIQTGTARVLTSTVSNAINGNFRCAIMTSRSRTNHCLLAVDYTTGQREFVRSALDCGTVAAEPFGDYLGCSAGSGTGFPIGLTTVRACVWTRGFTDEEMTALANNPYLGLKAEQEDLWLPSAAVVPLIGWRRARSFIIAS